MRDETYRAAHAVVKEALERAYAMVGGNDIHWLTMMAFDVGCARLTLERCEPESEDGAQGG